MPDSPGNTPSGFLRLVAEGHLDEVRRRLALVPSPVNAVEPHPFWGGRAQALHLAIETNRPDMFALLLEAGADVSGANDRYDHWSPLMLAIQRDRPTMRDALLARGVRVGLAEALLLGDDARVDALLGAPSTLPAEVPNGGSWLALARTPFAIDRLVRSGAPIARPDRWGQTPVASVSRLGLPGRALVERLVHHGATVTAVEYARLGDREHLARLHATRPDDVTADAVAIAAVDGGHHDLVAWLLSVGAPVEARAMPPSRHTALHAAAWKGDLRLVSLLVEAGARPAARDDEHHGTPLDWAETSMTVTNNPAVAAVVGYLRARA